MPVTNLYYCASCDSKFELTTKYEERDKQRCIACGSDQLKRYFPTPMVMAAALPDGTKRKGWDKMREASKLGKEMANMPHEKRGEIKKEIKKTGVKLGKE